MRPTATHAMLMMGRPALSHSRLMSRRSLASMSSGSVKMSMLSKPISRVMRMPYAVPLPDWTQAELIRPSFMGGLLLGETINGRMGRVQLSPLPLHKSLNHNATLDATPPAGREKAARRSCAVPDLAALLWPMIIAFASLVAAGIGAPIPEEIPVIGAGIWVASNPELGVLRWLILPVCFTGILISDVLLYGIGRLWGTRLLEHRWLARMMPPDRREQIESNFHHYALPIFLISRSLPPIR